MNKQGFVNIWRQHERDLELSTGDLAQIPISEIGRFQNGNSVAVGSFGFTWRCGSKTY